MNVTTVTTEGSTANIEEGGRVLRVDTHVSTGWTIFLIATVSMVARGTRQMHQRKLQLIIVEIQMGLATFGVTL